MIKKLYILFIVFFLSLTSQSKQSNQTYSFPDSTYYLKNIIIHGNINTLPFVITRELTFNTDSLITYSDLTYNSERIYSLGIFTKVELTVEPFDSLQNNSVADIHIKVVERLSYIIYPIIGTRDRDASKLFYGVGFAHTNFRGRKEYLSFELIRGVDPTILIFHNNPILNLEHNIFGNFKMLIEERSNRSVKIKADSLSFNTKLLSATLGKRYSVFTRLSLNLEWKQIKLNYEVPNFVTSPYFKDNIFTTMLEYNYDSRDLIEYPSTGTFQRFQIYNHFNPDVVSAYQRFFIDTRFYKPIFGKTVLTSRFLANIAQQKFIPLYDHVYFGYQDRLQGHYYKVLEGEHLISSAFELHIPIIEPTYIHLEEIPFDEFKDFRFATNFALFANSSTTWWNNDNLSKLPFYSGYGFGFHFLLPYSIVFKLEYAFGNHGMNKGEFLWDIGASF